MGVASTVSDVPDALDDIAYLARSERRVTVLQAIAETSPDRATLREETGIPRQTLARILGELEDRDWVERTGGVYRATTFGAYAVDEFTRLHDRLTDARAVADIFADLPDDAAGLGVEPFVGSHLVQATPGDPLAPVRQAATVIRGADSVRVCAGAVTEETLAANVTAVESGQQLEAVFDPNATAAIRNDAMLRSLALTLLDHGATLYTTSRPLSCSVGFADDLVAFGLTDDRGMPTTYLQTEDDRVREWAASLFADLVDDGERLTPETLDAE